MIFTCILKEQFFTLIEHKLHSERLSKNILLSLWIVPIFKALWHNYNYAYHDYDQWITQQTCSCAGIDAQN